MVMFAIVGLFLLAIVAQTAIAYCRLQFSHWFIVFFVKPFEIVQPMDNTLLAHVITQVWVRYQGHTGFQ